MWDLDTLKAMNDPDPAKRLTIHPLTRPMRPNWTVVTGRVEFDDEDTAHVYETGDVQEAIAAFKEQIAEERDLAPNHDDDDDIIFINLIVQSETEMQVTL